MGKGKGGELKPNMQNAFMAPQGEGGKWIAKADMPTARFLFSASTVDGKIYAFEGANDQGNYLTAVKVYDPIANKWTKKKDMPDKKARFSACAFNGKIYIIGGEGAARNFNTVEEYDPVTDTWTTNINMEAIKYWHAMEKYMPLEDLFGVAEMLNSARR